MECKAEFVSLGYDLNRRELLTVALHIDFRPYLDKFKDKPLNLKLTPYREKRSLDANAYFWVLVSKIAEVIHSDNDSVYIDLLSKYGAYTHIVIKENAVEQFKGQYRLVRDLGEVTVNGQTGIQLQCFFGSSTYDTKQMARLIDGAVSDCKDLDIETLTPDELNAMKGAWGNA